MKDILEVMDSVRLTLEETVSNEKLEEFDNAVQEMKTLLTNNPRVVLFIDGGMVQEIYTDRQAEIIKIDMDIDGVSDEEIESYTDPQGGEGKGIISFEETKRYPYSIARVDEEFVSNIFKELKKFKKED